MTASPPPPPPVNRGLPRPVTQVWAAPRGDRWQLIVGIHQTGGGYVEHLIHDPVTTDEALVWLGLLTGRNVWSLA